MANTTTTVFTNPFSKEIYEQTYKYGDEDIDKTHMRVAQALASVEFQKEYWEAQFLSVLKHFLFIPGGRIVSNAGTGLKGTSLINCFVSGPLGEDIDSMEGILDELRNQAMILKSEGGYGFCADFMRPNNSFIRGIGNRSPGAVRMLDMWDMQSSVITSGSSCPISNELQEKQKVKIRKGAQMCTMSCWAGDIEEFITAKQTPGKLSKFNMSVLITDEFMNAVENNLPWNLEFPDYMAVPNEYKKLWDGNLQKWKKEYKLPVKICKTFQNANELWNMIAKNTYNFNEPGVIFIDTVNRLNNLYYNELYISAQNPCGEQNLVPGAVCLLGSINLTQFINADNTDFDYPKLKATLPIALRMLDNVNDLSYVPLPIQKWNLQNKRRIGLGFLGYASALMIMKIRYGSPKALGLTDRFMKFYANTIYQASVELAKEKGAFPLFDKEKYMNSNFIKSDALTDETRALIAQHGIRNSHLLSVQPTGNSSVYCNNVSGGLEPIFLTEYKRTTIFPHPPGLVVPRNIDWKLNKATLPDSPRWEWIYEGDESLLKTEYEGFVWKYDRTRGLLRETIVEDYAIYYLKQKGEWPAKPGTPGEDGWNTATTSMLTVDEHLNVMKVICKYIDSSVSKTINVPNNYPYQDFKNIYLTAYKSGVIKGCTTYRSGTMAHVLSEIKAPETTIKRIVAPIRPEVLECDIYTMSSTGIKWVVLIGLYDESPYEIFAFKQKDIQFTNNLKKGKLKKITNIDKSPSTYNLETDYFTILNLQKYFENGEEECISRQISVSLKHGADIETVHDQLMKSYGNITSFSRAIAKSLTRYLKKPKDTYCKTCNDPNGLIFSEGCKKCRNCGYSACS